MKIEEKKTILKSMKRQFNFQLSRKLATHHIARYLVEKSFSTNDKNGKSAAEQWRWRPGEA